MFCYLNHLLFPFFPTSLSIVFSKSRARVVRVQDQLSLLEKIRLYNGYAHIFIRLYESNIVNKIVFDIDSPSLEEAIQDMLSLVSVFEEEKLPYIVLFSGRKGFHVYLLTKQLQLPDNTFRYVIDSVVGYYRDAAQLKHLDAATSYRRGWIRYPNTLHPVTKRYCTYIDRFELSVSDLYILSSGPRCPDINGVVSREPIDPREYVGGIRLPDYSEKPLNALPETTRIPGNVVKYLEGIVRPCVLYYSLQDNPSHFIRTQLATELCWLWFREEEICDIIEKLRWDDYDRRITCYHVGKICEKVRQGLLVPAGCETLRSHGYCLGDKCKYYPQYFHWWGRV